MVLLAQNLHHSPDPTGLQVPLAGDCNRVTERIHLKCSSVVLEGETAQPSTFAGFCKRALVHSRGKSLRLNVLRFARRKRGPTFSGYWRDKAQIPKIGRTRGHGCVPCVRFSLSETGVNCSDDVLRTAKVVPMLPHLFGRNEPLPPDLVGAKIIAIGTPEDKRLVKGGGLVIDYRTPAGTSCRLVLALNELAMWVVYHHQGH